MYTLVEMHFLMIVVFRCFHQEMLASINAMYMDVGTTDGIKPCNQTERVWTSGLITVRGFLCTEITTLNTTEHLWS